MASKKAGGSSRNGRDSNPKYYGVKKSDGQIVQSGHIIIKTDNRFKPGKGVKIGKDFTIYCIENLGRVSFTKKQKFVSKTGKKKYDTIVNVLPI